MLCTPRTDPSERDYRTGLLPWVLTYRLRTGNGWSTLAGGIQFLTRRVILAQFNLWRWLRRRSALSHKRIRRCLKDASFRLFKGRP